MLETKPFRRTSIVSVLRTVGVPPLQTVAGSRNFRTTISFPARAICARSAPEERTMSRLEADRYEQVVRAAAGEASASASNAAPATAAAGLGRTSPAGLRPTVGFLKVTQAEPESPRSQASA